MPTLFETPAELQNSIGEHLGYSDWVTITQEQVQQFADAQQKVEEIKGEYRTKV